MRIYNRYVLTVAVTLLVTTVALVALGQNALSIYYNSYIMEALVITELYVYLSPKARHGLTLVSVVLFVGFAAILGLQVVRLLT